MSRIVVVAQFIARSSRGLKSAITGETGNYVFVPAAILLSPVPSSKRLRWKSALPAILSLPELGNS